MMSPSPIAAAAGQGRICTPPGLAGTKMRSLASSSHSQWPASRSAVEVQR